MTTTTSNEANTTVGAMLSSIAGSCFEVSRPTAKATNLAYEDFTQVFGSGSPIISAVIYQDRAILNAGGLTKEVSIASLISVLTAESPKDLPTISAALPSGVFALSITDEDMKINVYKPGGSREIKYKPDSKLHKYVIPFPNMILYYHLTKIKGDAVGGAKWQIQTVNYFVTPKTQSQMPSTIISSHNAASGIFLVPFSNFYNTGGLCYGGNTMPMRHGDNLKGLDYFYDIIFESPFNNDLGVRMTINGARHSVGEFYKELSKLTEFPYEELRSSSSYY